MSLRDHLVSPLLAAAVLACGCASQSNAAGGGNGDAGHGSDAGRPVHDAGGADVDTFGGGDGLAGPMAPACSADLQNVVDADGGVVMQCPPDQGCDKGQCVPACQAAGDAHGSIGCDFVVATPAFETMHQGPCYVVFIANSWTRPVNIGLTYGATSYDLNQFARFPTVGTPATQWSPVPSTGLPPKGVAALFLSSDPNAVNNGTSINCPVPDAVNMATAVLSSGQSGTGLGQAFHITTDTPVNGYDVLPYGGAQSYYPGAALLLPSTAWGTTYVVAAPKPGGAPEMWAQIVASQDNTHVKVAPSLALPSGTGVAEAPPGHTTTYTLGAGQYIQWQLPAGNSDPTGTIVSSDLPVGVNAGNGLLCLSSATSPMGGGCDSDHESVPPVAALGSEYVLAPYATRRADLMPESIPYRFVGVADGTMLTFDPPASGAPATLSLGQAVDFEATTAFRVTSQDAQHPFYVAQMMSGCYVTGGSRPGVDPNAPFAMQNCLGDEEYLMVVPAAQWLPSYVFLTDPTYATANVVLVRKKGASGAYEDVTIDCVGTVGGWQAVDGAAEYQQTNVDFVRATAAAGACNNGPHTATSKGAFSLVVWGTDSFASYAYATGGEFASINSVMVPMPQ